MRASRWVATGLAIILLGACAQPDQGTTDRTGSGAGASDPSASAAPGETSPATSEPGGADLDLPTLDPPSGAPRTPTDLVPSTILVGRIVPGGEGPWCYTMETDDALRYALIGGDGATLAAGTTIRVKFKPADVAPARPAGCDGAPVTIVTLEVM